MVVHIDGLGQIRWLRESCHIVLHQLIVNDCVVCEDVVDSFEGGDLAVLKDGVA